jgi:hypothetical protein
MIFACIQLAQFLLGFLVGMLLAISKVRAISNREAYDSDKSSHFAKHRPARENASCFCSPKGA